LEEAEEVSVEEEVVAGEDSRPFPKRNLTGVWI
jgi:hypothetical protein